MNPAGPKDLISVQEIAWHLRAHYPDATSVTLFVNHQEHELSVNQRDRLDGISMKSLDGSWVKKGDAS